VSSSSGRGIGVATADGRIGRSVARDSWGWRTLARASQAEQCVVGRFAASLDEAATCSGRTSSSFPARHGQDMLGVAIACTTRQTAIARFRKGMRSIARKRSQDLELYCLVTSAQRPAGLSQTVRIHRADQQRPSPRRRSPSSSGDGVCDPMTRASLHLAGGKAAGRASRDAPKWTGEPTCRRKG